MSQLDESLKKIKTSTFEDQDQLSEFYLHNYTILDEIECNPLMFVGDLQIKALISSYRNEQLRGEIMEEYDVKEKYVALPVRREAKDS